MDEPVAGLPSSGLPPLIEALLDPLRYPHPVPGGVRLVETHGAWVLLAGEFAYKIKKPVKLSFMDFSTLDKRREHCTRELSINRRLGRSNQADQIYLAVLPLTGLAHAPHWGEPGTTPREAIEYALQMRRFDNRQQLDVLCQQGELTPGHLVQLAQDVAQFQALAPVADQKATRYGAPDDVMHWVRDNFRSLASDLPSDSPILRRLKALETWTESTFPTLREHLIQRRAEGRIREGHGDLHLGNLVLINGRVVPFDAIEFNDELRWIDVASEVAFLWMDLMHRKRHGLAHVWLSEWLDASGDVNAVAVLPFYAVYRALVRAKVAAICWKQGADSAQEASGHLHECQSYVALAESIAWPNEPVLAITHGLSGCGKSTVALQFLQAQIATSRCLRMRSDVERKRLFGLQALARSDSGINQGLYAPEAHKATYESLRARARDLLASGWTVVVDAAFLKRDERDAFRLLAVRQGCRFFILAPTAPVEVLRERIIARAAAGRDASEATLAVLEQQLGWLQQLSPDEQSCLLPARSR